MNAIREELSVLCDSLEDSGADVLLLRFRTLASTSASHVSSGSHARAGLGEGDHRRWFGRERILGNTGSVGTGECNAIDGSGVGDSGPHGEHPSRVRNARRDGLRREGDGPYGYAGGAGYGNGPIH